MMTVKNKTQLITYPDSLGGNLGTLGHILETHFSGLFGGGIHILPPFPSSGDRGFAPVTYLDIAPEFGTWEDIRRIGKKSPILLDLMVNHLSAESIYFQDFLKNGHRSEYADLFIPTSKIWPDGDPPSDEIEKMFLRRKEPFSDFTIRGTGEVVRVWTTFGKTTPSRQIDIDVNSETARRLLTEFMTKFGENDVSMVRLDAVGFVTKQRGTTCFFVEPEIYGFLGWISELANARGIEVLPEVHADYTTQFKLAERGYWIYDFILPYTVLEALLNRTGKRLKEYLRIRPHRQFTMLDCHDGVPIIPDLNGLYSSEDARKVVSICLNRGANLSPVFSPRHKGPDGFDVHQIRGTFYSLLDCSDDAYLAARAIQFFTPGVPQVYYVGLLAGENDQTGAERTGDGREINRHNYSTDEVGRNLQRPVVQRLLRLIRFRNEYAAFDGSFQVLDSDDSILHLSWERGKSKCQLMVNFDSEKAVIRYADADGSLVDFPL
ncbi:MAG TPA: sucrose phosphorylase [Anaerolineales bacterium]|nr:sucrose phosphorylase [Anaerolineales bacterium]